MDADRIRQAVETHGCDLRAKYRDEHRREEPDCAVCLIDTAALAYADLLDGPTDEDATNHLVLGIHRDEYDFLYATCTCGEYRTMPVPDLELLVDEMKAHAARAVFQARKERG